MAGAGVEFGLLLMGEGLKRAFRSGADFWEMILPGRACFPARWFLFFIVSRRPALFGAGGCICFSWCRASGAGGVLAAR